MKARRIFRASGKTAEERVREQTLREQLQKERPSLEDLVRTGACDPDAVMTMGMYFDVQKAFRALKREREQRGLRIDDVASTRGLTDPWLAGSKTASKTTPPSLPSCATRPLSASASYGSTKTCRRRSRMAMENADQRRTSIKFP